jgi:hypothetical protein
MTDQIHYVANDDEPHPAWLEVIELNKRLKYPPKALLMAKHGLGDAYDRSIENFAWFMRFQLCLSEYEADVRRENLKVVEP